MADDKHYVPGDFYRIDDRTGYKIRAKVSRKEWTSLIVHKDRWEPRQPQDFVKGVIDDQSVPEPRPRSPDVFYGPPSTSIGSSVSTGGALLLETGAALLLESGSKDLLLESGSIIGASAGSVLIPLASSTGMTVGDTIQIMLDTNQFFTTTIATINSQTLITISHSLPYSASFGNFVQDLTASVNVSVSGYPNDLS